jgi:hypothetical protein
LKSSARPRYRAAVVPNASRASKRQITMIIEHQNSRIDTDKIERVKDVHHGEAFGGRKVRVYFEDASVEYSDPDRTLYTTLTECIAARRKFYKCKTETDETTERRKGKPPCAI